MRSFADIPGELRRRVATGERVALVLLDALGSAQLQALGDHPLRERLAVNPLRSQFPSTTTAHVTTLHTGLPVEEHGLYEWRVLDPALNCLICPLPFREDGDDVPDSLIGRLDPATLVPDAGDGFFGSLPVPSLVLQPRPIDTSAFSAATLAGAGRAGFDTLTDGLEQLTRAFEATDVGCAYLYWPAIDTVGHHHGPSSPQFAAQARAALDALSAARPRLAAAGVTLLITADHGQVDVDPARVDFLDEVLPSLPGLLSVPRPAGSPRDVFLHVRPGRVDHVIEELGRRLGDRARVCRALDLLPDAGPRLRARLGDVAVLPAGGRMAWLRSHPSSESWMRGSHGGLHPDETSTYLAEVA